MSLRSWSGVRIARLAVAWILGLPLALFVVLQVWVFLPHGETEGVSVLNFSLAIPLLVLIGPPCILIAVWAIARRRSSGG